MPRRHCRTRRGRGRVHRQSRRTCRHHRRGGKMNMEDVNYTDEKQLRSIVSALISNNKIPVKEGVKLIHMIDKKQYDAVHAEILKYDY